MALTIVENGALFAAHHSRNAKARSAREFLHLPLDRINWKTSSFLIGTDRQGKPAKQASELGGLAWGGAERTGKGIRPSQSQGSQADQ
jgi:hypothetical protein